MSIIIIFQPEEGEPTELILLQKTIIGRSSKVDFNINDAKASSKHCSLEVTKNGQILYKDLESSNGSFLGHTQITNHYLKIGEKIRIGATYLFLDEKRMSPIERLGAGKINVVGVKPKEEITIPKITVAQKNTVSIVKARASLREKKISVSQKDALFEKEESSGETQVLTLDKGLSKKKK